MWQNRIVRYSEEAPDQLLANPRNWRLHPSSQADALRSVLEDVGVVQNVIANERTGFLIDGHLRVVEALKSGQQSIPVTWVDLSEDEEALVLATLDPLSALAGTDTAQLDDLLRDVSTDNPSLAAMLSDLATEAGVVPDAEDWSAALGSLPDGDRAPFQQMTFTLSDEQAETVKQALKAAQSEAFTDTGNENSNGNALARIAEAYLG